jgi:hypothetical protein
VARSRRTWLHALRRDPLRDLQQSFGLRVGGLGRRLSESAKVLQTRAFSIEPIAAGKERHNRWVLFDRLAVGILS